MSLAPLISVPIYQPWMWGGRNLARVLGRELPPSGPVAESWEVSDVDGAVTTAESEPYVGKSLRDLIAQHGDAFLGAQANGKARRFPLLIKYLDAQQVLSVQVHPGDEYAARHENGSSGKSEMWLVLEAQPGAEVIAGLEPGVGRKEVIAALKEDRVPEIVRRHPVAAGDVILIPAGRVHALGAGIIALEIQQTSNVTYRLYDWGRVGADGRPRQVHVERSLEVIDFDDAADPRLAPVARNEIWGTKKLLAVTPYFLTELWDSTNAWDIAQPLSTGTTGFSPDVLMLLKGRVRLRWEGGVLEVPTGRTVVVPAALGEYAIEQKEPSCIVRSRMPDLDAGLGEWKPASPDERRRIEAVCDRRACQRLFPSAERGA